MKIGLSPAWVASSVLFGIVAVVSNGRFDVPITLYAENPCPPSHCLGNVPHFPVLPILAALPLTLWSLGGWGWGVLVRALALGLFAAGAVGLVEVAAVPLNVEYFATAYRLYGLAYVAALCAIAMATLLILAEREQSDRPMVVPFVAALVFAGGSALLHRDLLPFGASAAGVLAGALAYRFVRRRLGSAVWSERHALLGVVLLAVIARAAFGLQALSRTGPGHAFALASDDGDSYFMLASGLAADPGALGSVLAAPAFPPGYSVFLAVILALTGGSMAIVILVQALLGGLGAFLVHRLARPLIGSGLALAPALLYALDMNLVQNQSTLTAEAILLPQILVALWALVIYRLGAGVRWLVVGAAAIGLAYVTRNVVAMPLIAALVLSWILWRRDRPLLWLRDVAVVAFAILVAASPVAVATAQSEGRPRLSTQLASLAWGFDGGQGYTVSNKPLVDMGIDPFAEPLASLATATGRPLDVLGFYAQAVPQRLSTLLFFSPVGYFDPLLVVNPVVLHPNSFDGVTRILRTLGLLVAAAILIAKRPWRVHPQLSLVVLYAVLYLGVFTFVFAPYHAFRYRIPIEPLRFIAEVVGLLFLARYATSQWSARAVKLLTAPRAAST